MKSSSNRVVVGRTFHRGRYDGRGWASLKSFQPKDEAERSSEDKPDDPGNPTVNFHGQKRSNKTHQSRTDADLRLFKKTKGSEAKLAYQGHVLMENRNGLVVNALLTIASGTAEREAALALIEQRPQKHHVYSS